ncbi:MAG: hypothetical protein LBD85_05470 [Oscillospiraceae bacterium]|jgi:hypothetical protein|nr:hypothetical protein [Oscillospiraceae bacterium]
MREEQVTKAILKHLTDRKWTIVAFDFPQSGTGKMLHPNKSVSEKNKGGIIPDIAAVKNGVCLFFENKDRTVESDFHKLTEVRDGEAYKDAIAALLNGYDVKHIYYGVGLPSAKYGTKAQSLAALVDFVVGVTSDGSIEWLANTPSIAI